MIELMRLLGEPQGSYPVVHITGTNGKGSTARMVTSLLAERGLSVGTCTSPDLERVNERMARNGEPIDDQDLFDVLSTIADIEPHMTARPHWFEIITAASYRWFADIAVDVAVVEVGMGGRWDATNVADADVAVVTNVSLDHADIIGPGLDDIAREKSGIVKPGSTLVLGETNPDLQAIFEDAASGLVWRRGEEFACEENGLAIGGRVLDLRTPGAEYPEVFLRLHGAYQGDNAAVALAAAEAFFGSPLDDDVVRQAFATVQNPGRMEVVRRRPLVVLDGAHNPAGAAAAATALDEEFTEAGTRVLLVGMLRGRDPDEMLAALDVGRAAVVVACPPPSPRALPAEEVAAAARRAGVEAVMAADVEAA